MSSDKTDFARLIRLQRVMKLIRERDSAGAQQRYTAAEKSLEDVSRMMNSSSPVTALFPDLLARHFQKMLAERAAAARQAKESTDEYLREKKKLETIEKKLVTQRAAESRNADATTQSETIDQRYVRPATASSKIGRIR